MNIRTQIVEELWLAIANSYEKEMYKNAVMDSIHFLSDSIREKTGIDADGASLVGQAFGGESPQIRVNKFQTSSDRDEQKGVEQILRGIYIGIRNPRSHEQWEDNKETAEKIILFIDHLLILIGRATYPFSHSQFLERVFDEDFVPSSDYAELLVSEIPENKMFGVLLSLYERKVEGKNANMPLVISQILSRLSDAQIDDFMQLVSSEFDIQNKESELIAAFRIIPDYLWPKIKRTAKMRIENKMIQSMRKGDVRASVLSSVRHGQLGAWASKYFEHFEMQELFEKALVRQLLHSDPDHNAYVFKYFSKSFPKYFTKKAEIEVVIGSLNKLLRRGHRNTNRKLLKEYISSWPAKWFVMLIGAIEDITDPLNPVAYTPQGEPLLGVIIPEVDDEIPF